MSKTAAPESYRRQTALILHTLETEWKQKLLNTVEVGGISWGGAAVGFSTIRMVGVIW